MQTLVAEILAAWRRAERLAVCLEAGSPERIAVDRACERLRDAYQEFDVVRRRARPHQEEADVLTLNGYRGWLGTKRAGQPFGARMLLTLRLGLPEGRGGRRSSTHRTVTWTRIPRRDLRPRPRATRPGRARLGIASLATPRRTGAARDRTRTSLSRHSCSLPARGDRRLPNDRARAADGSGSRGCWRQLIRPHRPGTRGPTGEALGRRDPADPCQTRAAARGRPMTADRGSGWFTPPRSGAAARDRRGSRGR
jgi:hypothetical protein